MPLALFFPSLDCLAIWNLLWFHTDFTPFFLFHEKFHWHVIRDCIESIDGFR